MFEGEENMRVDIIQCIVEGGDFWIICLTSLADSILKAGNDGTDSARTAEGVSSPRFESV